MRFFDNLKDKLKVDQDTKTSERFQGVESFFGRNVGDSSVTWGLALLGVFGIYALVELVIVVLKIF